MSHKKTDGGCPGQGPAVENETSAAAKQLSLLPESSGRPTLPAAEHAEWLRLFIAAVARRANRPGTFTVFEVAKEAQLPDPPHANLWGTATGIAHRSGLIVSVAATPSLRPRTAKSLVRLWVGAKYAERGEAA